MIGELTRRSFGVFWRHKYLWLLGILGGTGATAGFHVQSTGPERGFDRFLAPAFLVVFGLLGLVVLALALLGCATTPALIRAAAEHSAGRPWSFGRAFRAGVSRFWATLALRLLVGLYEVVSALPVFAVGFLAIRLLIAHAAGAGVLVLLLALVLLLVWIALLVVAAIIEQLALRLVALEGRGAIDAIGRALHLFFAAFGRCLLIWLMTVVWALAIGVISAFVLGIPTAAVLGAGFAAGGTGFDGAPFLIGLPLLVVLSILLGGVAGTFVSIFWTLGLVELQGGSPAPQEAPSAPAPEAPEGPPPDAGWSG